MLRITLPQQQNNATTFVPALPLQGDINVANQKTFELDIDVYLKDVCPYGNTYFSRYIEWQGMCRERFLAERILSAARYDGIFLTKVAHQEYVDETFVFQRIKVLLNTFQVKLASTFLLFRFMVDDRLVSAGYQQIVCASQNREIQRFPKEIYNTVREYEIEPILTLAH